MRSVSWPTVRVMRYRQHERDGTVIQAEWLTSFFIAKLAPGRFSSSPRAAGAALKTLCW